MKKLNKKTHAPNPTPRTLGLSDLSVVRGGSGYLYMGDIKGEVRSR